MKLLYLFSIIITLFSCKEYITEKNCFKGQKEKNTRHREFEVDNLEKIIKANPNYIKFTMDQNIISFEENNAEERNSALYDETEWKKRLEEYNNQFAALSNYFNDQFLYIAIQKERNTIFGVAQNQFGYWFLEIKNNIPAAYYLGLSNYTFINKKQRKNFVNEDKLMLYGSFVRIKGSWGYPFGPQMEVVKDRLNFECNLDSIRKDSDKDHFNDLFEKLVLLDPNSSDTDNDGISDFKDINPLNKAENSKFTNLYSQLIDIDYKNYDFSKNNYSFAGYFSDCDYFQKVGPSKVKVLIYPENERVNLKSDYKLNMFQEYVGKIKKDTDGKTFYINFGSGAGGGYYKAIYENGKWALTKNSTYNI
ncbi:hypothetical protein MUU74_11865 [Chryseobacterium daecheongense]|uniref:hypothetical protein n=1 Tax=Chryseobacterium daecheongense TaxID=192389 RepID=UPI001FD63E99|nr:hypothetical protein [Chryseobacterium daecheongense]UOU97189.1 hypothetical protein MUU74_11865 [Chryseobacterium daecheongense]